MSPAYSGRSRPSIPKKEILDALLKDKVPKTMFSSDGLLGELK
jgi:hypothetical protein